MSADKKYLKRLSDYTIIPGTDFLIEPYVPMGGLVFVCGLPKTFKTFCGIDWGYCVATKSQWLGHPTRKGRVAYYALENYLGALRRAEAWRVFHKNPNTNDLAYITDPISFAEKTCNTNHHFTTLHNADYRPDLVIVDTWFKATTGANVGDQPDMGVALKNLRDFQNRLTEWKVKDGLPTVTFVVIAHTDYRGQKLFGSVAQFADCDTLYMLERNGHANQATLKCIGARDIEESLPLIITLDKIQITTAKGKEYNLVITKLATVTKTKEDQDLEDMEFQLETFLGNNATFTDWLEQMWKFSNIKKDDPDKKGWSKRSFARKLDTLKNTARVTGGGNQGELYTVSHSPEAEAARHKQIQPKPPKLGVNQTSASQAVPGPHLECVAPVGTTFEAGALVRSSAMALDGTGSSGSGNGSDNQVVTDGAEAAANKTKELLERFKRKPSAA